MKDNTGREVNPMKQLKMVLLSFLVIALTILYLPVIVPLFKQWMNDPNYRHGLLVPVISGIMIYRRRKDMADIDILPAALPGTALIILSSVLLVAGTAGSELFTARLSLPIMIIGLSLFLAGKRFTETILFPLLFLFLMIPLPYIIFYKLTFPLQILSARLSSGMLSLIGINVIRRGNILILPNYTLEVVAACSGLRSLMTMFTLSVIMAALLSISFPRKTILVLLSIPAAIAANTIRLVTIALGATFVGAEFAGGTMHNISGLVVFGVGFAFLLIAAGVLKWKS